MAVQNEIVDWLDCVSAIETNKGVVYFCNKDFFDQPEKCGKETSPNNETECARKEDSVCGYKKRRATGITLKPIGHFECYFPSGIFLYSLTAYNPMNMQRCFLENVTQNHLLLEEIRQNLPGCKILNNFSYFPRRPHHFERGFSVVLPLDCPHQHEGIIFNLATKYRQAAYFKCKIMQNGDITQKLVLLESYGKEVEEKLVVVERLSYHPAFLHSKNNSVFHLLEGVMKLLAQCYHIPEVRELLDICKNYTLTTLPERREDKKTGKYPIIAVEGVAKIGVAQQSQKLSECLGAQLVQSPPSCIRHLRHTFDQQNQLIKSAFYFIGNYITCRQIADAITKHPVVVDRYVILRLRYNMDVKRDITQMGPKTGNCGPRHRRSIAPTMEVLPRRYWYSSAAFTIVSEVGCGSANLPPKGHSVYKWPSDLQKPTAVVLLSSKESQRGKGPGCKENKSQMIHKTFLRMKTPSWIEVNKSRSNHLSDESTTTVIASKLQDRRVISFTDQATKTSELCPGMTPHPEPQPNRLEMADLDFGEEKKETESKSDLMGWGSDIPALILH
ncbi:UMP-CMP kinase 2, mitochondrial [Holothuria leucospilota]|uniref:UMP-CMP kinase 2, mitochondrial n=1 Tax=Holothuria leucospilota TaxID=206669 RepID=A0A9Q0YG10_HOLLE|nr:UMP-CMP kinase 2, mitochondrial [Holothuria leucospilota]